MVVYMDTALHEVHGDYLISNYMSTLKAEISGWWQKIKSERFEMWEGSDVTFLTRRWRGACNEDCTRMALERGVVLDQQPARKERPLSSEHKE